MGEFEGSVLELESELTKMRDDVSEEFSSFQSEMLVQFTEATTRSDRHPAPQMSLAWLLIIHMKETMIAFLECVN